MLLGGDDTLEVVGESFHLDNLWQIVGGRPSMAIRRPIQAALVPELYNPYDENAVAVRIDGLQVGHLSRQDALDYRPGLQQLCRHHEGHHIGLRGVIIGEGDLLGVFLDHDPADFGVSRKQFYRSVPELRTGLSEALGTDFDDESYDLSWLAKLPRDDTGAVTYLRQWLLQDRDPISRHYLYCHLQKSLYRLRELSPTMLAEFDEACALHDAEMDVIRECLVAKFGKMPMLETYRQVAIRHQKAKNWSAVLWWSERGLRLYGDLAGRPEATEDLKKRAAIAGSKVAAASEPKTSKAASGSAPSVSATLERMVDVVPIPPVAPPVAPAQWYADPTERFEYRWWDGYRWTPHVSRNGEALQDHLG